MAATHTKFELVRKINTIINKQVAIRLLDILNMRTANAWVIKGSNHFHDIVKRPRSSLNPRAKVRL